MHDDRCGVCGNAVLVAQVKREVADVHAVQIALGKGLGKRCLTVTREHVGGGNIVGGHVVNRGGDHGVGIPVAVVALIDLQIACIEILDAVVLLDGGIGISDGGILAVHACIAVCHAFPVAVNGVKLCVGQKQTVFGEGVLEQLVVRDHVVSLRAFNDQAGADQRDTGILLDKFLVVHVDVNDADMLVQTCVLVQHDAELGSVFVVVSHLGVVDVVDGHVLIQLFEEGLGLRRQRIGVAGVGDKVGELAGDEADAHVEQDQHGQNDGGDDHHLGVFGKLLEDIHFSSTSKIRNSSVFSRASVPSGRRTGRSRMQKRSDRSG